MKINGVPYRTLWLNPEQKTISVLDQTRLPHAVEVQELKTWQECETAIKAMVVRGAPLIGATAAYGVALAMRDDSSDASLIEACRVLREARPTAVNLMGAIDHMKAVLQPLPASERANRAFTEAAALCEQDVETCYAIGQAGLAIIEDIARRKNGGRVNILTHCNAGWLGCIDWGTALSPIYQAFDKGIDVHVWVDETRPRNQGAFLTAFELGSHGVPHTVIVDNAGGHLMQEGHVDLCIVGADRVACNGDVANKIGTYLKALAAVDNQVPFYVAVPFTTIDWTLPKGVGHIEIEERSPLEVSHMTGLDHEGVSRTVRILPREDTKVSNLGFDVTPARLVTGLITERGVCSATEAGLKALYGKEAA